MANLIEGLQEELKRNRELVKHYEEIGPAGIFGKTFIQRDIDLAEKAIATGDTVEMVRMYATLKENK